MKKTVQGSKTNIPRGMATHLPEGASLRRHAQEMLLSSFFQWGYKEVVTPVFEYLDILSAGLSNRLLEKSYKFTDRESGKLMLLRPDITPQIARMVAGILSDEPKPLRLCYYGNVFRYQESHAGREREMFQVGCELAGPSSPEADAEIIAVACEAVRRVGIEDFKIVIGHGGYLYGIISYLRDSLGQTFSPENQQSLQEAIGKKDGDLIESILDTVGVKDNVKKRLLQIPNLFGGDEIFEKASLIAKNRASSDAIKNLQQIYSILRLHQLQDYILFDLCDIRGIDYYTGMFFEIFSPGMAYPVGRGGRYDNLIGKFGHACPSTGFALNIESIIMAREKQGRFHVSNEINFLITGDNKDNKIVIDLARKLRQSGFIVVMDTGISNVNLSVAYAKRNNIDKVLVVHNKTTRYFTIIDIVTGKITKNTKDQLTALSGT